MKKVVTCLVSFNFHDISFFLPALYVYIGTWLATVTSFSAHIISFDFCKHSCNCNYAIMQIRSFSHPITSVVISPLWLQHNFSIHQMGSTVYVLYLHLIQLCKASVSGQLTLIYLSNSNAYSISYTNLFDLHYQILGIFVYIDISFFFCGMCFYKYITYETEVMPRHAEK